MQATIQIRWDSITDDQLIKAKASLKDALSKIPGWKMSVGSSE